LNAIKIKSTLIDLKREFRVGLITQFKLKIACAIGFFLNHKGGKAERNTKGLKPDLLRSVSRPVHGLNPFVLKGIVVLG